MILNGTRMHLNDGRTYPTYMKDRYLNDCIYLVNPMEIAWHKSASKE